MLGLTSVLCVVILSLGIGRITPIDGAWQITKVVMCENQSCSRSSPAELPYFAAQGSDSTLRSLQFRVTLTLANMPEELQALYVPKFADHLGLQLNGHVLRIADFKSRQWAQPQLVDVPPALLNAGENTLDVTLYGRTSEGMEMFPLFFGPRAVLMPHFDRRFAMGPAFARFNLAFIAVLGLTYLAVWWQRREERQYLNLGLCCAFGCVVQMHFGYGTMWGGYHLWTGVVHLSIAAFALTIMKFVRQHLGLEEPRIERTLLLALVLAAITLVLIPTDLIQDWAFYVNVLTGISAIAALTLYWLHRHSIPRWDFGVIFGCLALASTLGLHEMVLIVSPQEGRSFHMFHIVPACVSLLSLWVIINDLVRSLRRYEVLTDTLGETIAQKTVVLERSFARLAEVERREAVDDERNRIMRDLHDGIGGQLVSTLAYMESTGNDDPTLKEALEAALRDLALVLDSLDSQDSLATLLGMLRTRLEPLMADHGLSFDWQIHDDPVVSQVGPSSNLHLARIVQEAITNVIKHAEAQTITVYTDATSIQISDDGVGIDPACLNGAYTGHGLNGMRERAQMIGATFEVARVDPGTRISLHFVEGT